MACDIFPPYPPPCAAYGRWYFGSISKQQAQALLQDAAPGAFLLRESKDGYVISGRAITGEVRHTKIHRLATGYTLDGYATVASVEDLIRRYTQVPVDAKWGRLRHGLARDAEEVPTDNAMSAPALAAPTQADGASAVTASLPTLPRQKANTEENAAAGAFAAVPASSSSVNGGDGAGAKLAAPLPTQRAVDQTVLDMLSKRASVARSTVQTVLETLQTLLLEHAPSTAAQLQQSLREIAAGAEVGVAAEDAMCRASRPSSSATVESHSAAAPATVPRGDGAGRLQMIFNELRAAKDDYQQRNWAVYDDSDVILEYLSELMHWLESMDPTCIHPILSARGYDAVQTLGTFYQTETRLPLREQFMPVLGMSVALEPDAIPLLLESAVPVQLARDIRDLDHPKPMQVMALTLAAMIFATGEQPPTHLYDTWNRPFIELLIGLIEGEVSEEHDARVVDSAIAALISFNLHFTADSDNSIMAALAARRTATTLCERLLLLMNRGEDPVHKLFTLPNRPAVGADRKRHWFVIKFMKDLFSRPSTARLVYTNDLHVLYEIVVRELHNQAQGSPVRRRVAGRPAGLAPRGAGLHASTADPRCVKYSCGWSISSCCISHLKTRSTRRIGTTIGSYGSVWHRFWRRNRITLVQTASSMSWRSLFKHSISTNHRRWTPNDATNGRRRLPWCPNGPRRLHRISTERIK